jgi:hypothetical protein
VTTARPGRWETPLGVHSFRHIKANLFYGYRRIDLGGGQHAFLASPEKALLDLLYLQPEGDTPPYLRELRLQNLEHVALGELRRLAERAHSPKLKRATEHIAEMAQTEALEYETL